MQPQSENIRSFLRWAGSKRQLLPILSQYWTVEHKRYLEPFAGSACLFFYLQPNHAILGDINEELISTYGTVKHQLSQLLDCLNLLHKNKELYYYFRQLDPASLDSVLRATRFIYLNRFCFNGLYRTNKKGLFNVPYGGDKSGKLPSDKTFIDCSRALQNAKLLNCHFLTVVEQASSGDFVYIDPPYKVGEKRVFNEYDASSFDLNNLQELRSCLEHLTDRGVEFLVSYANCNEAKTLSKNYDVRQVNVRRNIAGFSSSRRKATELLISNKSRL